MNISETVRRIRTIRNMTIDDLSKSTNLSKSTISLIENDKRNPSLYALECIAEGLDLPLSRLISISENIDEFNQHMQCVPENFTMNIGGFQG